jgi:outer membrane receptor protein involved in Fe transport
MNSNPKLSYAIAAILSGATAGLVHAAPATTTDADTSSSDSIQEITVTAQRRTENIQNVPISIQALTGETLGQLNVATVDDFVKYLPNVSTATLGPGQGNLYMRGLSVGALGTQGAGSVGEFPNVGVYLDDQSTQLPGRNLDVYAADLQRIEVLEGPQGTLFGAGAQAGVIRYITNKPKLDTTEGDVSAAYSNTAHGDPNSAVTAVLNIPLISDTLAVRGVIYSDSRGGYISNVPGTFTRKSTDLGIIDDFGGVVPAGSAVINNNSQTGDNQNTLTYKGTRLSGLYKINDDWDVLLMETYQEMNAQGVFYEMPKSSDGAPLAPLEVTLFNPSYDRDRFTNTALTVNGKVGPLKLVYSGAYLDRHVNQTQDYTNYARGVYAAYYQCPGAFGGTKGPCNSPSSTWLDTEANFHQSHEVRLSTPDDWRIRAIGGLYWEKQEIHDDTEWQYKSIPDCSATGLTSACFLPVQPFAGGGYNNGSVRNSSTAFFDDFQRNVTQKAAFTSVDFDIIPKVLTLTGGTRYFDIENHQTGDYSFSFGCYQYATTTYFGPCTTADGGNFVSQPNRFTEHGFRSRGNLTWHVTDDILVYYTYSQGFRPGGFNRGSSCHLKNTAGEEQWCVPYEYQSDDLTNQEIGWKTEFLNHRVQVNGAVYQEEWNNVQTGIFDPQGGLGNLTVSLNGPNYRVRGVELQLVGRVTEGLTLQGSASWNSSELTNSPYLLVNSQGRSGGVPAGTPSTPILSVPNPYGALGSPLANSPPFQVNGRARYEWSFNDYQAFSQLGFNHQAHSYSSATAINQFDMPGWTQYEASLGVGKDKWTVEFFGQNLTDVNKSLFTTQAQFVVTEVPIRPRILGLRFNYKFADVK